MAFTASLSSLLLVGCAEKTEVDTSEPTTAAPLPVGPPAGAALAELATGDLEAAAISGNAAPEQTAPIPAPIPDPAPFAGQSTVTVDQLLVALEAEVDTIAASPEVAADYAALIDEFGLQEEAERLGGALYLDYVRVKIAFEATRDGGWWGLAWDITNEQPNSELIWAQWRALEKSLPGVVAEDSEAGAALVPVTTAIAECDELSALFAFVAHRIGLERDSQVGLLWPTGNHVVAVWTVDAKGDDPTRIVVPTTQIFLTTEASLGTRGFDPWAQRTIFDYRRQDAKGSLTLPGQLASYFVTQVQTYGPRSQAELLEVRAQRMAEQE